MDSENTCIVSIAQAVQGEPGLAGEPAAEGYSFSLRQAKELLFESGDRERRGLLRQTGGRLLGAQAAVKISGLLGRSRLRRKRGRLFLRLEWRSRSERLAPCFIGLTPSSFSSVNAVT